MRNLKDQAANGYAYVRVDLRGAGDSEGVLRDEYVLQEQEDALEVLDWIASQSWCDGAVGTFGYSWACPTTWRTRSSEPQNRAEEVADLRAEVELLTPLSPPIAPPMGDRQGRPPGLALTRQSSSLPMESPVG